MAVKERIDVEGNFKQQLNDLISGLTKSNNAVKDLANNIIKEAKTSENSVSYFDKRVNQLASNLVKQGNTVKESLLKATKQVEQEQEKSIEKLAKQYMKLGSTIQDAYKNATNSVGLTYSATKGGVDSLSTKSNESGVFNDFIKSFFGSSLGKGLTVLGVIQGSVKAVEGTFKLANNISSQTLGAINTLSGNMLSKEGFSEAMGNAMDFEDVKTNIMVLSKQLGFDGQKIYETATRLATATRFTEKDVAENSTWMLKAGINPDEKLMTALGNLASLKPELGASHAGFSVFDAMLGRVTSLKTNYGISNEMLMEYQKTLTGSDKSNTADAIEKSGSGTKVKDKQSYANLLELYVNSKYGDLAEKQSKTLSGFFSTMKGGIEQLSSDLMGFNTIKGEVTEGSFISVLKDAMGEIDSKTGKGTGFLGWLQELKDNKSFVNLEKQIGNLASNIVNTFQEIAENKVFDELMNIASDFLGQIGDFISRLKETGQLDKIISDFPKLVQASLNYELAKVEAMTKMAPLIPVATRFLEDLTNFIEFISGKSKLNEDNKKVVKTAETATTFSLNPATTAVNATKMGWKWLIGKYNENKEEETKPKPFTDISARQYIDRHSDLSKQEKDQIKEMIKTDNTNTYNITLNGGESKEEIVRLLIEEVEKAQNNS